MLPTIWGVYISWRYMLILDISCQHLGHDCKLEGFCVPFGHRVWNVHLWKYIFVLDIWCKQFGEYMSSQVKYMRVNKFIVKSIKTSNKLKEIETVSRRSRPRSNNTQKINSQCRWRASHSEVWLHWAGHRIISITKCDTSRLLVGKRYHFPDNIVSNYVMDRIRLERICKKESNVQCCQ